MRYYYNLISKYGVIFFLEVLELLVSRAALANHSPCTAIGACNSAWYDTLRLAACLTSPHAMAVPATSQSF